MRSNFSLNDSPTYRTNDSTNGKIVSSRNATFTKCVGSNTPSMVDDIDEGSKSSDDLESVYDGIQNMETTGSDNVGDDDAVKTQHGPFDLAVHKKRNGDMCVVCFLPIYCGHQVRWTYQPGSHRIFHPPSFCGACLNVSREKDSAIPFPRRPRSRILCTNDSIVLHP